METVKQEKPKQQTRALPKFTVKSEYSGGLKTCNEVNASTGIDACNKAVRVDREVHGDDKIYRNKNVIHTLFAEDGTQYDTQVETIFSNH